MQESKNDHADLHNIRLADESNDIMPESSGSGSAIEPTDGTEPSDDTELKSWHIVTIAVGTFSICFLLACLVSSQMVM